jgi:glycosyltransferase involved in cell wall biosynthesis
LAIVEASPRDFAPKDNSIVRILKTVQAYYPFQERGGPVVKVRALAHGLAARGHQVTVLTADLGLHRYNGSLPRIEHSEWGARVEDGGVTAIYLPSVAHYRALTWNPRVIRFSRSSIESFDVVHFYGLYDLLGPVVSHFCRRHDVPYVIEPMGMYRPIDRSFRLKMLWRRTLGAAFWKNAAQIIATSEMEQQELLEEGVPAVKLMTRYNGIDVASYESLPARGAYRAKWNIPKEEPVILFLSRLIPRKGADILIEAFAEACPASGRLIIAGPDGEPGYRAYLEKCAGRAGVTARVIFPGALYDEEKRAALVDADIFALPSRYENFANVAAEAMACGVPVIVSKSCGICSLVEGQAGLVIPVERAALGQALQRLLYDPVLYARLKAGCHKVVSQLNWDRLTEKMEGYYKQVMSKSDAIHRAPA